MSTGIPHTTIANTGNEVSPRISIVGTGPAGLYTAQTLLRALPNAEITLWDRSPMPFGLIREGVAADHPHTKRIVRQFDRLWQSPQVRFAGGVTVTNDDAQPPSSTSHSAGPIVSIQTLRRCYDAVVLATGRTADRLLSIPGADLPLVRGAGTVVRRLNAAPGADRPLSTLGSDVVLVGAGNVALDILRFLVKTEEDYEGSDVDAAALAEYCERPAQRITVLARSSVSAGSGDTQMWRELAALPRGIYHVHEAASGSLLPNSAGISVESRTANARIEAVAALTDPTRLAALPSDCPQPQVDLYFEAHPLKIESGSASDSTESGFSSVEFAWDSATRRVAATSVITAIGFDVPDDDPLAFAAAGPSGTNGTGMLAPGLYRTGWLRRGPVGAIPENRACAKVVAQEILDALESGELRVDPTKPGFTGVDPDIHDRHISTAQWQLFDAAEIAAASPGRNRTKYASLEQLIAATASTQETNRRDPE